jgi:ribonuclease-3
MSHSKIAITPAELTNLTEFVTKLEIPAKDLTLYREALTHRSYLNEVENSGLNNNERLEYLGDAVLELIVTEYLFEKYPDRPEGEMTSFRAALVRTESLADESLRLEVGNFLYMSNGEERTGGRKRPYILANTFEAILGAIYLDLGFEFAKTFVFKNLLHKTDKIVDNRLDIDSKSKLQEIAQEIIKATPIYELIEALGPDHNKVFTMGVYIDGVEFAQGKGKSKQDAEQKAASEALQNWETLYQNYKNSGKISPEQQSDLVK